MMIPKQHYKGQYCFNHYKDKRTRIIDESIKLRDIVVEREGVKIKYKQCPKCFIQIKAD